MLLAQRMIKTVEPLEDKLQEALRYCLDIEKEFDLSNEEAKVNQSYTSET